VQRKIVARTQIAQSPHSTRDQHSISPAAICGKHPIKSGLRRDRIEKSIAFFTECLRTKFTRFFSEQVALFPSR
jgi:hypothetical protein